MFCSNSIKICNAAIDVKLLRGAGGEAGHRQKISTQISFSVQMPGPRKVILGKKCKFLTPGALLLVKRTQRMIKSPYPRQTCNIKSPFYARPPRAT